MKKAWVLAGGGAKGAFQAGAMTALQSMGHYPDNVFGTSVGALNAACYTWHGVEGLQRMWMGITKLRDVFTPRWNPFANSLFSSDPLKYKISQVCAGEKRTGARAWACYCDLWTGETNYMGSDHPDYKEYVLASASLPLICPPVRGRYIDGGAAEPCPLNRAVKEGADQIVVILCSSLIMYCDRPKSMLDIAIRSMDIACAELVRNDVSVALKKNRDPDKRNIDIKIIQPDPLWTMGTLDFSPESIAAAYVAGSDKAREAMK